jgi:hypothetical protein
MENYSMKLSSKPRLGSWLTAMLAVFLSVFFPVGAVPQTVSSVSAQPARDAKWSELLQRMPYPYVIPLPEPKRTNLDSTYTKVVVPAAERVHCRRCPDYAPEGGLWMLNIAQGVFRIYHPESGWKSIATVIVAGDRLLLANDPSCIEDIGVYAWRLENGRLILQAIDDPCAIRLRAMNLTQLEWRSCRPPNIEAAVTEHWIKPEGCD